ncbi:MAG: DNA primase [Clostridiales bacterium]|nr:DNA primase [Clostridiales bacterium]
MGRIPESDVARVRDATDVIALISESVVLNKKGRLYWGLCPFHSEKTPSFKVDPATQMWHCFGCAAGGDVFGFLMRRENLEFPEAVRLLAERAHIEIAEDAAGPHRGQRERLIAACEDAAEYYHHLLTHSSAPEAAAAREYLAARGFGIEVARRFTLGFAPGSNALTKRLAAEGFTVDEIVAANLAYVRESPDKRLVDRFYGRIMFPIRDVHGRVIAFGGRVVGGGEPKYLNSSDTPVFRKSENVYAIDRAKNAIIAEKTAVVVEGYTDVIALHEAGITHVVATLGTALTRQHVNLLARFTENIVYLFDGDAAGLRAAARAAEFIDAALASPGRREIDLKVALLPDGLDPAELVATRGAAAMHEVIAAAEPLLRFAIDQRLSTHDLSAAEGRARALRDAAQVIAPVKGTLLAQDYANHLADRLRIDYVTALAAIDNAKPASRGSDADTRDAPPTGGRASDSERSHEHIDPSTRAERALVSVAAAVPDLRMGARRLLDTDLLVDPVSRLLIETVCAMPSSATTDELYRAVAERDTYAGSVFSGLLMDVPASGDVDSVVRDLVTKLKEFALERQIRESTARYRESDTSGDATDADEQFRRVVALQSERDSLRRGVLPKEAEVWGFE